MVTASHNPKEYNGFKMSIKKYDSLYGDELRKFEDYLECYDFRSGKVLLLMKMFFLFI